MPLDQSRRVAPPATATAQQSNLQAATQAPAQARLQVEHAEDAALRNQVLSKREPLPTSRLQRNVKNLTVSTAVTTCAATLIGTYILPGAPTQVLGAAAFLSAFVLMGVGRWFWNWMLAPVSGEIPCLVRNWVRTWHINRAVELKLISKSDARNRKRKLLDDYLEGNC